MKSFFAFTALALVSAQAAETFAFYHENVLGTSLELRVSAESAQQAKAAETKVLSEIDRLSAILNTWKADSEISRWQTAGGKVRVSSDLAEVLAACDTWSARSEGAFNAGVGAAGKVWKAAAAEQKLPTAAELTALKNGPSAWTLDGTTATYLAKPGDITVDGLAKGYIIDRAVEAASADTQIHGIMLNIGGDLRVSGEWTEPVAIADPRQAAENAPPLAVVPLKGQGMATSGDYRRGYDIAGRHYSHIIDPRTAMPVDHVVSASVVAPDATTADALATAFNVLQPEESIAVAEKTPGVSCLIVSADGRQFRSSKWDAPTQQKSVLPVAAPAGQEMELTVDFELNKPEAERYLRPYLAIWAEDKDGFPVRTLNLWILKGEKGLRWLPDLKRWSKADKMRRLADPTDIVPTVSSATRNPGKYSVVWDGLDDQKQQLPAGEYTLYIEAAREKGTYQLMKHVVKLGGEPFKATLEGNEEVKSAALDYHAKAAAN